MGKEDLSDRLKIANEALYFKLHFAGI